MSYVPVTFTCYEILAKDFLLGPKLFLLSHLGGVFLLLVCLLVFFVCFVLAYQVSMPLVPQFLLNHSHPVGRDL